MSSQDQPPKALIASITENVVQESKVYFNVGQDVIITTEDKLRGALRNHLEELRIRDRWHTPASLFLALALVFVTASFHDALAVPKATWQAIFLICAAGSFVWLAVSLIQMFRCKRSIDTLLAGVKRSSAAAGVPSSQEDEP